MNAAGLKRDVLSKVERNKHATCRKLQRLDVLSPFSNAILPWSMKGNRLQFYTLCPSDRSGFFACFSFQMVWLNFEGPERQAEGERYKSFNNLFKRLEKSSQGEQIVFLPEPGPR